MIITKSRLARNFYTGSIKCRQLPFYSPELTENNFLNGMEYGAVFARAELLVLVLGFQALALYNTLGGAKRQAIGRCVRWLRYLTG